MGWRWAPPDKKKDAKLAEERERAAREHARPSGNVTPLPRMQEPDDAPQAWHECGSPHVYRDVGENTIAMDRETHRRLHETGDPHGELPYPEGPLASRRAPYDRERQHEVCSPIYSEERGRWWVECSCGWEDEEKVEGAAKLAGSGHLNDAARIERARALRSLEIGNGLTGVRIYLTWPGDPGIAEVLARNIVIAAETIGFGHLDTTVQAMEEGPGTAAPEIVECPDCKGGRIEPLGRCDNCGLSYEALLDAEVFFNRLEANDVEPT